MSCPFGFRAADEPEVEEVLSGEEAEAEGEEHKAQGGGCPFGFRDLEEEESGKEEDYDGGDKKEAKKKSKGSKGDGAKTGKKVHSWHMREARCCIACSLTVRACPDSPGLQNDLGPMHGHANLQCLCMRYALKLMLRIGCHTAVCAWTTIMCTTGLLRCISMCAGSEV